MSSLAGSSLSFSSRLVSVEGVVTNLLGNLLDPLTDRFPRGRPIGHPCGLQKGRGHFPVPLERLWETSLEQAYLQGPQVQVSLIPSGNPDKVDLKVPKELQDTILRYSPVLGYPIKTNQDRPGPYFNPVGLQSFVLRFVPLSPGGAGEEQQQYYFFS